MRTVRPIEILDLAAQKRGCTIGITYDVGEILRCANLEVRERQAGAPWARRELEARIPLDPSTNLDDAANQVLNHWHECDQTSG